MSQVIRSATPSDTEAIVTLVKELATYERERAAAMATAADFDSALFGPDPQVFCHLAEIDGDIVGFSLWYVTFSTWTGRHGIWLEDLFVRPERRGTGLGRALLAELAQICIDRGYSRLEWSVLNWNTPARDFYRSIGATPMDEWTAQRLDGHALTALAGPEHS